ncbi:unnamed protein product [Ceutorhynchus assimilis]|uniref:Amino acid transporter transmembrane domain-containing protein n=1 Tax=Ceutorhynchus assimilis TaxID=467358 RepID=A0A9N9MSG8_9CUCU|nr:unnamed protein product [Ceutorhynchus assimilis]
MEVYNGHVLTLANSIIGVSILAMPYCFKKCGIFLAIIMLLLSNLISRLSCHFLIKSAIIARRKHFEYLAYHIFGSFGKFAIEVGMIGFLVGTCIAFFVVMGDLGPAIISEITGHETSSTMRSSILLAVALFCVLPLGLLKNVDSLSGVSKATIGFYICLVVKIVIDAMPRIFQGDWITEVVFWKPEGVIQCLPIFSMALSCQTQLFEIYQVINNPSLEKMNHVIKNAVNICTIVYFFVGFFGYVAFANTNFTGNILLSFDASLLTNVIKLGFILSIAFSFPLVIFPCRASAHSLIYRQGITLHENVNDYIPEGRFKGLTVIIVLFSLVIGILIPNIEFVLGLVGSSIGIIICVLFPVICFIYISQKDTNERLLAKGILVIGLVLMILGTHENIRSLENAQMSPVVPNISEKRELKLVDPVAKDLKVIVEDENKHMTLNQTKENIAKITVSPEIRHEPPQPMEPQDSQANEKKISDDNLSRDVKEENNKKNMKSNKKVNDPKNNEDVDIEAIKKEDTETLLQENKDSHIKEHQIILDQIQQQNKVQGELVEQQKKLIEVLSKREDEKAKEEKLIAEIKAVKEIESIALKAIEKISGDSKENKKIVAELEKDVLKKEKEIVLETINNTINKSQNKVSIEDLKHKNSLLSARIKQNNMTQKSLLNEIKVKNTEKDISNSKGIYESLQIGMTNSNKTGKDDDTVPLLVNLGQETKKTNNSTKNVVKNMLPLPLILQQNSANNSDFGIPNVIANKSKDIKNNEIVSDEDAKVLRRDILTYIDLKR